MLDIAVIKSTPKAADTPPENNKKPASRDTADEARQEFQSEYEAANDSATKPTEKADDKAEPETDKQSADEAQSDEKDKQSDVPESEVEVPADFEATPDMAVLAESAKVNTTLAPSKTEKIEAPAVSTKPALNTAEAPKAQPEVVDAEKAKIPEDPRPNTQVAKAETARSPTKAAAETVVMSRAVPNASEATISKEAGPLPSEAKPSPAATENRATPQPVLAGAQPDTPITPRLNKGERGRKAEVELRMTPDRPEAKKVAASASQNLTPKVTGIAPAQIASFQIAKDKSELSGLISGDLEPVGSWETRTVAQTTSSGFAQTLGRAETPVMIARQMAEALQRLPDRPVEISLNPRELGRVRMSITAAEAGITVNVVAERPETLDLMRRNIEQLTREFENIGYESINFAFAEGEARKEFSDQQEGDRGPDVSRLDLTAEEPSQEPLQRKAATTGVDIRV